jgi:surfeit locus 1 family protein
MSLRKWSFLLLALLLAAVCIRLGFWQLDRLEQRRLQNEAIKAGLARQPINLNQSLGNAELSGYQRVSASGEFDSSQEILLSPRARNGQPGVHLVTPLILPESNKAILVDRGWIPAEERALPDRGRYEVEGMVTVIGFLQAGGQKTSLFFLDSQQDGIQLEWPVLDIPAIQGQIDHQLINWILVQEKELPNQDPQPIPEPEVDLSEGPHLGYAIQWFSFAAIALFGGGYWFWRQRRQA